MLTKRIAPGKRQETERLNFRKSVCRICALIFELSKTPQSKTSRRSSPVRVCAAGRNAAIGAAPGFICAGPSVLFADFRGGFLRVLRWAGLRASRLVERWRRSLVICGTAARHERGDCGKENAKCFHVRTSLHRAADATRGNNEFFEKHFLNGWMREIS